MQDYFFIFLLIDDSICVRKNKKINQSNLKNVKNTKRWLELLLLRQTEEVN